MRVELHKLDAMVAFAEAVTCRRRVLLGYFGDEAEVPEDGCGNCDVCLDPPEVFDGTVEAQKALSAVWRTGQRFGVKHVIDVLRGADTDAIRKWGHEQLPTYGVGADVSRRRLALDPAAARAPRLPAAGHRGVLGAEADRRRRRRVLRGEERVTLARWKTRAEQPPKRVEDRAARARAGRARRRRGAVRAPARAAPHARGGAGRAGVRRLRRRGAASTWRRSGRATREEFLDVHGVGEAKAERYAEAFLGEIAGYAEGLPA